MREMNPQFVFNEIEKEALVSKFSNITISPYKFYPAFKHQVRQLVTGTSELSRFIHYIDFWRSSSTYENPFLFLSNCPIDQEIPIYNMSDPVRDKYENKKTFVSEVFLQLYADLAGQHPISYLNVNDGDVFQDIYPKEALKDTQSQKALGPIYFHKDLANHFVRPDFVNILSLRSSNDIYTTFTSNKDILENMSEDTQLTLRQTLFYTPFDDLTVTSNNVKLGDADKHPILSGYHDLRVFENRTKGLTQEAQLALDELLHLAHKYKKKLTMLPGDFVGISNNLSIHGKEIGSNADLEDSKKRYSLKTVNVYTPSMHLKHFVDGTDYLVRG